VAPSVPTDTEDPSGNDALAPSGLTAAVDPSGDEPLTQGVPSAARQGAGSA
jgi:hypothetical protein